MKVVLSYIPWFSMTRNIYLWHDMDACHKNTSNWIQTTKSKNHINISRMRAGKEGHGLLQLVNRLYGLTINGITFMEWTARKNVRIRKITVIHKLRASSYLFSSQSCRWAIEYTLGRKRKKKQRKKTISLRIKEKQETKASEKIWKYMRDNTETIMWTALCILIRLFITQKKKRGQQEICEEPKSHQWWIQALKYILHTLSPNP